MTTAITFSKFGDLKAGSYGDSAFLRPSYQATIHGVDSTLVINEDAKSADRLWLLAGKCNSKGTILNRVIEWSFDYGFLFSTTSDAPRYDRLTSGCE